MDELSRQEEVRAALTAAGVTSSDFETLLQQGQSFLIVSVPTDDVQLAASVAANLNSTYSAAGESVIVTIRPMSVVSSAPAGGPMRTGVQDDRALALRQLIASHSRTSEINPSLAYIPDAASNIVAAVAPQHHLIFGRRGAGKTALMAETRRRVVEEGHLVLWINMQTYRNDDYGRVSLYVIQKLTEIVKQEANKIAANVSSSEEASRLSERAQVLLSSLDSPTREISALVPQVHGMLKSFLTTFGRRLYLFIDDFYYLPLADQAPLLDLIHGYVRDTDAWIKVASIRNLTRWYLTSPPTGLQTGQDAAVIDLDVTLQEPDRAKHFLENVLMKYAERVGIPSLTSVFSGLALDRLVLASGGVPRDYLTLCSSGIEKTRVREGTLVGVQDVNQAAGDAAQVKIQELEDDGSANPRIANQAVAALSRLRSFCLDEEYFTYFRVDVRDRDRDFEAYGVLNRLVEFRLAHLIHTSVSDSHHAGERSEAFMLDLSQYSGARLKQKIQVLDIRGGNIVAKRTRDGVKEREATTARELLAILRAAPVFELSRFRDLVSRFEPLLDEIMSQLGPGATRTMTELLTSLGVSTKELRLALDVLVEQGQVVESMADGRAVFRRPPGAEPSLPLKIG